MTWKAAHREASMLMAALPPLPQPWRVEELCRRLADQRGRDIMLHRLHLPALPFGLWYDDGRRDHIIYREGLTGYYRDHVILHEICHMLAGHNMLSQSMQARDHTSPGILSQAIQGQRTKAQEELAEMFASRTLKLAALSTTSPATAFERRAAAMFGAV